MNKKAVAADLLRWSGGGAILRAVPRWEGLLVLNYHRIGDASATEFDRDVFSASAAAFEEQIAFLNKHFDVISPADISALRRRAGGRAILITFDDGYRDNYELAFPALKRQGAAATFFICTGFLDRGRLAWWDEIAWMIRTSVRGLIPAGAWIETDQPLVSPARKDAAIRVALARYKLLPEEATGPFMTFLAKTTGSGRYGGDASEIWMTWDMVREMNAAGMTIGAHTDTHPLLGRISEERQRQEIERSRARIAAELGAAPGSFAYPVGKAGAYDAVTKRLLREAGFTYAFNFRGGHQTFSTFDEYDIARGHVGHGFSRPIFEAMATLPTVFAR